MNIDGKPYRTIWLAPDGANVHAIDQTLLPHQFIVRELATMADAERAIRTMIVRGAPLIGAAAAYGMALAMGEDPSDAMLARAYQVLFESRPTAVNLRWALDDLSGVLAPLPPASRRAAAYARAAELCDEDVEICRRIGAHGLGEIRRIAAAKPAGAVVHALTHCNAGWLCAVDWGTALAPIYQAHDAGISIHVWVDETRPRNQGASLTAWELGKHGVPHTVIADNAGGHLMQRGQVDLCIVGTDRTTRRGDVCNKIGTYLKALAAHDNRIPFYVALPYPTIDWTVEDGLREIPIEERAGSELGRVSGRADSGEIVTVSVLPAGSPAANPAFDVTPARLVTRLITERGVCAASEAGLLSLYPERGDGVSEPLRWALIETCLAMNARGINQGTSGNASVRLDDTSFLITPSGMPYDEIRSADVVTMTMDGTWYGARRPSSEWRFHRDILTARPEVHGVVHTHGVCAAALACLHKSIPAFHYMVAAAGGDSIRCADYATFGTQKLSDHALRALDGRRACLLANHGMIATGVSLGAALALAIEVEALSSMYLKALSVGRPELLSQTEMKRVLELFRTYGTPAHPDHELRHGGASRP